MSEKVTTIKIKHLRGATVKLTSYSGRGAKIDLEVAGEELFTGYYMHIENAKAQYKALTSRKKVIHWAYINS